VPQSPGLLTMTIEAIVAPRKTSSETRRVAEAACVTASARMVMSKAQYNRETGNARVLNPFDAVLVVAFGGPQGPADIRPFLENVLRGRRVAPGRLEEVAHHYELFGGVSPITALTLKQADGLRSRLIGAGAPLPVYVGMRNWHPFLVDTLAAMAKAGVRRAIGFIAAAHRSYSSCTQYRENVAAARAALAAQGLPDVEVTFTTDWHTHPGFIAANVDHIEEARRQLPPPLRDRAKVVFTAHSIPVSMAERYPYQQQIEESVGKVMERLKRDSDVVRLKPDATVVYQSRSGRAEDPWLGPDICDYLRDERSRGLEAAVISPIGFVSDHVEVLYDLDVEAAGVCREIGLPMARAASANDHPRFLDAMADAVLDVHKRYAHARPLELVREA
jgi:protoporphyrin/coproporphyrin ferrochelatase